MLMDYNGRRLRHEQKYYISYGEYYNLVSRLNGVMQRDVNGGENGYFIRSLYFDDMHDSAYYEKEAGVYSRTKYRIRIYNYSDKDGNIKLEQKCKIDRYISKSSAIITKNEFYKILDGDTAFLLDKGKRAARDFYIASKTALLHPTVIVDYYRDAFTMEEGNVRITFDKELRAGINTFDVFDRDALTVKAYPPGRLVMEVKYDDYLPKKVQKIIQPDCGDYMAVSKYVLCRKAKDLMQRKEILL